MTAVDTAAQSMLGLKSVGAAGGSGVGTGGVSVKRKTQGGTMEAYCVKCKAKKEMKDAKQVKMKNGRAAMKGKCPACGTGLYRILGSS